MVCQSVFFLFLFTGSSRKELKQARLYQHYDQEQCKYCYACNKYVVMIAWVCPLSLHTPPLFRNASRGRMVSCDFCPLIFHLDCLHPPLTIPPTTVWMCPVHPNAKIVSRRVGMGDYLHTYITQFLIQPAAQVGVLGPCCCRKQVQLTF